MDDQLLWAELGRIARRMGALPNAEPPDDAPLGLMYFNQQFERIKQLFCTDEVQRGLTPLARSDVGAFVDPLRELFARQFGAEAAVLILVQLYKIGFDRVCGGHLDRHG